MADNVETASGVGCKVATDAVTYSGDASQNVQLVRNVWVVGAEGSKTVVNTPADGVKKYYTNAGAVTDGIIWSPASGKRWYITSIFINVSAAATITLEDDLGAGDSAIWKAELTANSGWSASFPTPWFSGEDAADLLITTTAGNVYVTVVGFEL